MRKKLLCWQAVIILLVLFVLSPLRADKVYASGFNSEVREGTAVVAADVEFPREIVRSAGSCFFVGKLGEDPEYLVTNHHVIENYLICGAGEPAEVIYEGEQVQVKARLRVYYDSDDYEEAYVVDYDSQKDIAVLKLASPTAKRKALPLCLPTDNMIGASVYCVGYPGLSDNGKIDATSKWGITDASITSGTISRLVITSGTGVKSIQTDAAIHGGNSGGPMVNGVGSVIGVNTRTIISNEVNEDQSVLDVDKVNYAVSIEEVIPMLKRNDIPYVLGKGNTMLIIGIALAVVLAVILVVVLVVALNKRGKKPAPQPVPPQTKKGMIRSMSVQHNGMSFPIGQTPIMIGRDRMKCGISFGDKTPGVSAVHCSVSWNPSTGEFLVTDLHSSFGTYLINGQKLEPNTPYHLKPGDSFYLGENTNILRVEMG